MTDTPEVLCYRCGNVWTRKRADGKPVCQVCFLRDALANRGYAVDYHDLTPLRHGQHRIPQAPVTPRIAKAVEKTAKKRASRQRKPKS